MKAIDASVRREIARRKTIGEVGITRERFHTFTRELQGPVNIFDIRTFDRRIENRRRAFFDRSLATPGS